jgi:hypothetical protein
MASVRKQPTERIWGRPGHCCRCGEERGGASSKDQIPCPEITFRLCGPYPERWSCDLFIIY